MNKKLTQAIQISKSGDKHTARLMLREIVDESPETLNAWFWLADAMPDDAERIDVLEEAVGHHPEEIRLTSALARLIAERRPADAEQAPLDEDKLALDSDPAHAAKDYDPFLDLEEIPNDEEVDYFIETEELQDEEENLELRTEKRRRSRSSTGFFLFLLILLAGAGVMGWLFRDSILALWNPTAVTPVVEPSATEAAAVIQTTATALPSPTAAVVPSDTPIVPTQTAAVSGADATSTPIVLVTPTNTAVVEEGIYVPVPGSQINDIAWSQDGEFFAVAGDGGIVIYDGESFLEKTRITLDPVVPVLTITFSNDNQYIAAGFDSDGSGEEFVTRAKMWKVNDGAEVMSFDYNDPRGDINALAFTLDGEVLLMNAKLDTILKWRVADGALLDVINLSESAVDYYGVAFSPDRLSFATFSKFDRVRLYDTLFGEQLAVLGESKDITNAIFSRSNQYLAVMFEEQPFVYLWDLPSQEKIREWNTFNGNVTTLAFDADNQTLAVGTDEDLIKFYQIRSGEEQRVISRQIPGVLEMEFAPDDVLFAVRNDREIQVWHLLTDTLVGTFRVVGN